MKLSSLMRPQQWLNLVNYNRDVCKVLMLKTLSNCEAAIYVFISISEIQDPPPLMQQRTMFPLLMSLGVMKQFQRLIIDPCIKKPWSPRNSFLVAQKWPLIILDELQLIFLMSCSKTWKWIIESMLKLGVFMSFSRKRNCELCLVTNVS